MAEFEVKVVKIDSVEKHPNADRLTINNIGGYQCISNLDDHGNPRYKAGDLVVYIPEAAVLPEWLLRRLDMWDWEKNKGVLHGAAGNRVKIIRLRQVYSQGILYPVGSINDFGKVKYYIEGEGATNHASPNDYMDVKEGDDVAKFLGIIKYEPPVPTNMMGQMGAFYGITMKYDFDSIQKEWNMFEEGEIVQITEKIHGTNCQIGINLFLNDPELFGKNNNIFVTSKGIGAKGYVLKNTEENKDNLYVRTLKNLLDKGVEEYFYDLISSYKEFDNYEINSIHIFGEIFGSGVQKGYDYGLKEPEFRMFDLMINSEFTRFTGYSHSFLLNRTVPVLYTGPFSREKILELRDGKSTFTDKHIREGIVIKSWKANWNGGFHYDRKIAKFVSPEYLLKATGEEIQ